MYPKTARALRFSFAFVGILYGLVFLGHLANIVLAFRTHPNFRWAELPLVGQLFTLFLFSVVCAFGYVVVRFYRLLYNDSRAQEITLHYSFWGQIAFVIVQFIAGYRNINSIGAIFATALYVSLLTGLKKVDGG